MKIKSILGVVIALWATLLMSVAVSAATNLKAGTPYTNTAGTRLIVPIIVESTDIEDLSGYQFNVNYSSDYTYATVVNVASYYDENVGEDVTTGTIWSNEVTSGDLALVYTTTNFLDTDENNQIELCRLYFSSWPSTYSANDFTMNVTKITTGLANAEVNYTPDNMASYFTFDVTGDLGGNKVVALYASTDDGVTKQQLEYYTATDYVEGETAYADATTSFLVAVESTKSEAATVDITIYGQLSDGSYVPLGDYAQDDFLVQTFE